MVYRPAQPHPSLQLRKFPVFYRSKKCAYAHLMVVAIFALRAPCHRYQRSTSSGLRLPRLLPTMSIIANPSHLRRKFSAVLGTSRGLTPNRPSVTRSPRCGGVPTARQKSRFGSGNVSVWIGRSLGSVRGNSRFVFLLREADSMGFRP